VTSGDTNGINHLILSEDLSDGDFLLELAGGPFDLLGNGSSVNLDLHNMGLLLSELELLDLSGAEDSDGGAVLLDSLDVSVDVFLGFGILLISLGVVGESLLLGKVVVLVESSHDGFWELLGPDGGESSHASWGLDVPDHTNDLHWWSLDDGDWLNDILSDGLLTLLLLFVSHDVSHTGFVTHEGREMDWLGSIIWWE
jgi:hypothetical protein